MNRRALRQALLRGRNRPRLTGIGSPTVYRGDGYEFVELREYVPGDDPRRIDWAATARAATLQSRVILEDVALTFAAILDKSPSMRIGRSVPLVTTGEKALAAWFAMAESDDRCIRITMSGLFPSRAERGAHAARLACAAPDDATFDFLRALIIARSSLAPGSALLVVGDFFDLRDEDDMLLSALGRRFDCTALVARDPWHDELPLRAFVRLRDAETGEVRSLFVGRRERALYADAVREREQALRERLSRANWRAGALVEDRGEESLLNAFLPT
ncbi:MAG: DUF58 domain-containing protein [Candidatus Eremiobacteraeota bacterium]|nr:DUF58 domain-containing protein [Candidatus Eremiobacteraeota bacterium]